MKLVSLFLLAGAALSASPLTTVSLVNAGSPLLDDGRYYVGPYTLSINGQNMPVMCVDANDESYVGQTWTAAISQVGGDISSTYHPDEAVQYKEEAYLFNLITQPGADRIDIQHAAWSITDPAWSIDSAAQSFVTQAENHYADMDFSGFELVSSVSGDPRAQEFMVSSAPEPGSLTLLGAGLMLGAAGLVRRKKLVQQ